MNETYSRGMTTMINPIRQVLIANRGEIALRCIRACRKAGVDSLLVVSAADKESLPAKEADRTVVIGPAPAAKSYLFVPALLAAAKGAGADAVHPGYGFLAENAEFADACRLAGLAFIGPTGDAIRLMGDKARAREMAKAAGVPTVPGSDGLIETAEDALREARRIGFPVLLKATAGGGGKGMRLVENEAELADAMKEAAEEARKAFGFGGLYIEKYFTSVHHVEIQLLADKEGNVIALGERDCSSQRRHQKLIEESPSPIVDPALRAKMADAAKRLAKAAHYESAGTVEFIVDEDKNFYFMEMNTRIQVEHPVTEMVTGADLVETMLHIAEGEPLPWKEDFTPEGWAIECRINAEDPEKNFAPSPGFLKKFALPTHPYLRVDTAMEEGASISPFYDSLIAKLIVHGADRADAINKMLTVLSEVKIEGVATTAAMQKRILSSDAFREGRLDTAYIESHIEEFM